MSRGWLERKTSIKIMILLLLSAFSFGFVGNAYADYYGTGSGSGGSPGCPGPLSTCYGATWQWYDWEKIRNGDYADPANGGIVWNGGDSYTILGTSSSHRDYANAATIDVSGKRGSCSGSGIGLWRYAMVAMYDYTYSDHGDTNRVAKNQQVGLLGVDSNPNYKFDSQFYGGWVNYYDGIGKTMDEAHEVYAYVRGQNRDEYPIDWNLETGADGALAWFCGPPMATETNFSAISNVNNSASNFASTGVNDAQPVKVVYTNDVLITERNKTIKIAFSHNIYSTSEAEGVEYEITRTGFTGNGYYAPGFYSGGDYTGTADFKNKVNEYGAERYVPNRTYSSGGSSFIWREESDVSFYADGEYLFCEMVSVASVPLSKVCTKVTVTTSTTLTGLCGRGELGPYTPSDGRTWVLSRAKNARLSGTYRGWQSVMYAMPGDTVGWVNCYFPGAQYYANYSVTQVNGTDVAYHNSAHNSCGCTSNGYKIFKNSTGFDWTSLFQVSTTSRYGLNDNSLTWSSERLRYLGLYRVGDTTKQEVLNNYIVNYTSDVGRESGFVDVIYTNAAPIRTSWVATNHYWSQQCCSCRCGCTSCTCCSKNGGCHTCYCPTGCNCTHYYQHCNTYNIGTYRLGTARDSSQVLVPYNFVNRVGLSLDRSLAYSGDEIGVVNAYVSVNTRYNNATEADYATIVRNAQVKMVSYVSSSGSGSEQISNAHGGNICEYFAYKQCSTVADSGSITLNSTGRLEGTRQSMFNDTYNVFDASAGDYVCFAIAVYPASSGADTNVYSSGDGNWYIAAPQCRIIAKKPSIQVLGGSVYSNGGIATAVRTKHNLYGITSYSARGGGSTYFGSWAEESILSNGYVSGFASGATIGRNGNFKNGYPLFGSTSSNYCDRWTPLSLANYSTNGSNWICGQGYSQTGVANIPPNTTNRVALADYFAAINSSGAGGSDGLGSYRLLDSGTGKSIGYTDVSGNHTISGGNIYANTTRIVKVSGDITINGDISYANGAYTSMANIPKVVIYAGGNVNIACTVTRIDAIIIAGVNSESNGVVNTCYNAGGLDDRQRSNQLTVNGVIMSNGVVFGRTYGNAVGEFSGTAAEVINYDTSALVWGRSMADAGESDSLTTVYQHELAPRY